MPTITYSARTASSVTITIAAVAGETAFEIEANRSPDFASDESISKTGLAAGATVFSELAHDTPWYFRARKTNAGNGPWTATLMAATLGPAAAPGYSGFSHEPALLVVPEPVVEINSSNLEPGSRADSLLGDDPMSTMRTTANAVISFRTTGRGIDTLALLGTLSPESHTLRIRTANSVANLTAAPTYDSGTAMLRTSLGLGFRRNGYHALRRLPSVRTDEWWRVDVAGVAGGFFMARHLVVGLARQSVNISRGAGATPNDYGQMSRNVFGSPDRVLGWRGRTVDFPLSWINEAEYQAKWSVLDQLVGTTSPVLAVPNPKANAFLNDRIAFGCITNMRGEVMRGNRYSKSIEIDSLY